ncbi:NAD-dependent epimerase/dehydratase family protein [Paenibacillus sp. GP183]|uniref:NAD-dependent epimerase/dehydratase family protein n=1 Tax=Paenibacillus sp. GP183 TaxID=1882751 RepID=UPI000899919A|nr:NAD-dependent epimerase/dehydratase family protein [Paenibacillus sp. GP183]SEC04856.1 UDP-glucose 4-epimerase [Paenibacillus sp. GP183]
MNVLVTGGAGFIGSNIVDSLIDEGYHTGVVDNISTGFRGNVNPRAEFFEMDIANPLLSEVFASFKPELVIHHAAQIDVRRSILHPEQDAAANIMGTLKLLEMSRTYEVRKIIYASSAAVYGAPQFLGITEDHPKKPQSFYGVSKLAVEPYIDVYSQLYGLDYTILRYANVYGMRQDPRGEGGVVSIFIDKLLRGESPMIYGSGEQTRDFIYIKDVVRANLAAIDHGAKTIVNIGTNRQTSTNDLLKLLTLVMGEQVHPIYQKSRAGDIEHSRLDNSLAKEVLKWEPRYSLMRGLEETFAYYKND